MEVCGKAKSYSLIKLPPGFIGSVMEIIMWHLIRVSAAPELSVIMQIFFLLYVYIEIAICSDANISV